MPEVLGETIGIWSVGTLKKNLTLVSMCPTYKYLQLVGLMVSMCGRTYFLCLQIRAMCGRTYFSFDTCISCAVLVYCVYVRAHDYQLDSHLDFYG